MVYPHIIYIFIWELGLFVDQFYTLSALNHGLSNIIKTFAGFRRNHTSTNETSRSGSVQKSNNSRKHRENSLRCTG